MQNHYFYSEVERLMTTFFSSDFTLGILGGGQLGKMLLYDTRKYDIKTAILDADVQAPARLACDTFVQGDLLDFKTVYNFGKKVDLLTYEIETVNIEALEKLEQEGVTVYPQSKVLRNIQDKGMQKLFYREHKIPTSGFDVYVSAEALIASNPALPFVWKSRQGGYDGKGVQIVRSREDLNALPNVPCLAEALVPFKNELAVIVARSASGEVKTYPVVEMEFHPEANQVEYVLCPARIPEHVAAKARNIATQVSEAFQHVGLLAVELFLTEGDQILVNEVAPRPHNSGHYSIEGSYTNQFEQHLRAILNLPLGDTDSKVPAVMVNLVGAENHQGDVVYEHIDQIMAIPGVTPHIYGKKKTRPFRKMGHVTIAASDIKSAREKAAQVKEIIKVIAK